MHRIVSARNIYQSGFHYVSLPSNSAFRGSIDPEIKCSFCRKVLLGRHNMGFVPENLFVIRHQSTKTANVLQNTKSKKVKYKNHKKYGEVIEVGDKSMSEMKVSIDRLRAKHLTKLAASPLTLEELHQLINKPQISRQPDKTTEEIVPEVLEKFKEKILNSNINSSTISTNPPINPDTTDTNPVSLSDDQCALIFTSQSITNIENRLKTKQYLDTVKESYYNFRKATLYDQKLKDLRFAISEGLNQEFDLDSTLQTDINLNEPPQKGAHAVFREFFSDNNLDKFDQDFLSQISKVQSRGIITPSLEEAMEEDVYHSDLIDTKEDLDLITSSPTLKTVKLNKLKNKLKAKKANREKKKALQEKHMKQDIKELEMKGKQERLHRLLAAHLQLLCSLNMVHEGRRVFQYYRSKGSKVTHPKITDVNLYNTLMHGYAAKGLNQNAKEILAFLEQDGVHPNAQSYAALFESIERSDANDKLSQLKKYVNAMEGKGITLNDLLDKTCFLYDQREVVLRAIKRVDQNFVPNYTPPFIDYVCPLLDGLNLQNVENRNGLFKSPAEGLFTVEELRKRGKDQIEAEINGEIKVENIYVSNMDVTDTMKYYRNKLLEVESEWRSEIKEAFIRNLATLKSQCNASHLAVAVYPYLTIFEPDQFVHIIMSEINKLIDGSESYSPTLKLLQRDLGLEIYKKYQIEQYRKNGVLDKIEKVYAEYCEWYVNRGAADGAPTAYNCRQAWQMIAHRNREGASLDFQVTPWPVDIRQNIGKFLYNIIINSVKINVNMFKNNAKPKYFPAVYKVHRPWGRLVRLELKPHPLIRSAALEAGRPRLNLAPSLAPTTAPPAPWTRLSATPAAYLLTHTDLVRLPLFVIQQQHRMEEAKEALHAVYDSLNQLGEVPWKINQPILDLQLQVFRSGGDKKLDIARPPSALDTSSFAAGTGKASMFKRRVAINRAKAEMYSLWCDALYKLSLANHYRDEIFWLPHNMDFRGRVYACPPHLSQLGADSSRALLLFANPRPLGKDGLDWLKVHAINLTGTMKNNTVQERLQHANSILDLILDSADNPLDGKKWWAESDEPWQTLACCKEIANATRHHNPQEYMCQFPVHQDGSCNGLQHYAALGRDEAGARSVNLAPLSRPQDVYTAVADLVERMRVRDALEGVTAAQTLSGFVRRRVVKQTVMTTVYGVTRYGARLQIAKQLKDIEEFPQDQVWACSQYLTARTFDSLAEMFTSTKLIQDWFTQCAKLISGVCGESVEWVTPLGLPVVQPYFRRTVGSLQPLDFKRPCTMKQRNAFPPNFIHSLDSTHMMLTGLHCQARGITFVSVHDCFWTHPDTVNIMNKICREQFVALHSQPILEDLSKFLVNRFSYDESQLDDESSGGSNKKLVNTVLSKVPKKGTFKLDNVLKSVYFFS